MPHGNRRPGDGDSTRLDHALSGSFPRAGWWRDREIGILRLGMRSDRVCPGGVFPVPRELRGFSFWWGELLCPRVSAIRRARRCSSDKTGSLSGLSTSSPSSIESISSAARALPCWLFAQRMAKRKGSSAHLCWQSPPNPLPPFSFLDPSQISLPARCSAITRNGKSTSLGRTCVSNPTSRIKASVTRTGSRLGPGGPGGAAPASNGQPPRVQHGKPDASPTSTALVPPSEARPGQRRGARNCPRAG